MLKPEDNERLVRVGPGKPAGELMRRYWQPALLCEELPENDCAPVRVRLLGEDLIAFRDTSGRIACRCLLSASAGRLVLRAQRGMWSALRLSRLEV